MGLWGWSDSNPVSTMAWHWDGGEGLGIAKPRAPLCGAGIRVAVRFQRVVGHRVRSCVSSLAQGLVCNWLSTCDYYYFIQLFLLKPPGHSRLKNLFKWHFRSHSCSLPRRLLPGVPVGTPTVLALTWGRTGEGESLCPCGCNDLACSGKAMECVGEANGSWGKWTLVIT